MLLLVCQFFPWTVVLCTHSLGVCGGGRGEGGGKGRREVEKEEGEDLSIGHTVVVLASMLPQRISPSAVPPYPK